MRDVKNLRRWNITTAAKKQQARFRWGKQAIKVQTAQNTRKEVGNLKEEEPNQSQTEGNASSLFANSSHPALVEEELENFIQTLSLEEPNDTDSYWLIKCPYA